MRKGGPAPSTYTANTDYYYERKDYGMDYPQSDYPPMPAYGQPYGHGDQYQFNSSVGTLPDDQHYDDNDYGSTAHLALSAAPMADDRNMASPRPTYPDQQQSYLNDQYGYDPHAAYRGPSPVGNVAYGQAYTSDMGYGDAYQEHGAQYHQHQASQGGYAQNDRHAGSDSYDYGTGQAHAM